MNLVPFVMGVTGFTVLDGQPVVDSLFLSMEMYFLNYSDSPPNILIEIARWTAPLMTASGVLMSISKIRGRILQLLRDRCRRRLGVGESEEIPASWK
ncbi:hypothetical protein [Dorea longicatena]|uniref:hypothetical protein n=1 Tax=Dorea longicatena TaxID=88431 RepID=UPI000425162F|nr:hypothetical protein [Dorea longicatena]